MSKKKTGKAWKTLNKSTEVEKLDTLSTPLIS